MSKKYDLPAMPFYWGDWFKATDVQLLPREIRMTWMEMLGRMWENEKRGYLSTNNSPLTIEELARLLGFGNDVKECEKHINFLEKKRIFSRTKAGIIYNRRIVRDMKLSKIRSKSGITGMKTRYGKHNPQLTNDNSCYNKTSNKGVTNTEYETEDEYEDEYEDVKEKEKKKKTRSSLPSPIILYKLFLEHNTKLPKPLNFSKERKDKCVTRLKDPDFIKNFTLAVQKAQSSPFLCGENDRGWKATFDWFITNETNIFKVLEGKYDDNGPHSKSRITVPTISEEIEIKAKIMTERYERKLKLREEERKKNHDPR